MANVVRLVDEPTLASVTGRYFNGAREKRARKQAYNDTLRAALDTASRQLCQSELAARG